MAEPTAPAGADAPPARGRGMMALLFRDPATRVGMAILVAFVCMALLAPWIAPYNPVEQNIRQSFRPPSLEHWFGTDEYGRDILSRVVFGARPALVVGVFSVLVSMLIGMPLGMIAGLRGGRVDMAVSALVDVMMSFPSLLLALLVVALVGSGLHILVLAIGIAHVPIFIRLTRSSTLLVRELDYVAASRSFGARDAWIMLRHVLPNIVGPLMVMATLSIAGAIRDEAALSFLGLGIQPPQPSWGNLIREGVNAILSAPWMSLIPGLVLAVSVLAFNMIGDSLRDVLDPRDIAASAAEKGARR